MNLNIFTANKELAEAKKDNESLLERLSAKETEVTQALELVQALSEDKKGFDQKVETVRMANLVELTQLTQNHQKQIEALNQQLEETKQSAGKEAAKLVASMGVDVGTIKETISRGTSDADIVAKFKSMSPGTERTSYYNQNKVAILRAAELNT